MDNNQQTPVSDDQELANVLAGMHQQSAAADDQATDGLTVIDPPTDDTAPLTTPELKFEDTPVAPLGEENGDTAGVDAAPAVDELPAVAAPGLEVAPELPATPEETTTSPTLSSTPASGSSDLDEIKKDALEELRPLVDKLDLPADEKFDTILLLIRSTDDKSLVNAAHEAARAIPDEAKRAQALLDVIKEIDYFSGHGEQPA